MANGLAALVRKGVSPSEAKKRRKAKKIAKAEKAIAEGKARGGVPPKGTKPAKKKRVYR